MSKPQTSNTHKNKPIKKALNPPNKQNTTEDPRFAKAKYDPKFMAPSAKVGKVAIDKRFSKMLKDSSFNASSGIDRYGRQNNPSAGNKELEEYYYMQGEEENNQEQDEIVSQQSQEIEKHGDIRQWMENYNEESSELQDIQLEDLQEDFEEVWEEEDQADKVIKGENVQATRRLALCNYDWMNISSKDLMILFNSFKPKTGYINNVKVYMSNIGKQNLQKQQLHGPTGIWRDDKQLQDQRDEHTVKRSWKKSWKDLLKQRQDENEGFDQGKLRSYEKQRLKYFYAVIQCDSKRTADQIYRECDGNQFQLSTIQFDLRFVPDDTPFDSGNLKQQCNQLPSAGEVKNFINRAQGHSSVGLSWEDPQLSLAASLKKKNWSKLSQAQLQKIDWGIYIDENQMDQQDQHAKMAQMSTNKQDNTLDWRQSSHKRNRTKNNDDIEITFEGGFDSHKKIQNKEEVPSLNKQKKSMKQKMKDNQEQKRKKKEQLTLMVDDDKKGDFAPDIKDPRFKKVYENDPLYAIDPVDSRFDHRRIGKVFAQVVKNNQHKNNQ